MNKIICISILCTKSFIIYYMSGYSYAATLIALLMNFVVVLAEDSVKENPVDEYIVGPAGDSVKQAIGLDLPTHTISTLNLVVFYLLVLLFIYFLTPKAKKAKVIYVKKTIDPKSKEIIKELVKSKFKELKTLIDSNRNALDYNNSPEFAKKMDQVILEIKKIIDLHKEFKNEILDSHYKIISDLCPEKSVTASLEVQKPEVPEHLHEVNNKINSEEIIEPNLPSRNLRPPNIQTKSPFPIKDSKIPRDALPQNPQFPKKKEEPLGLEKNSSTPEAFEEQKINKIEKNELGLPSNPIEIPRPKPVIPRPVPIGLPKLPPIRGKANKPTTEERSKYVPPSTIKSSPFG
jgi:hypothetical protein